MKSISDLKGWGWGWGWGWCWCWNWCWGWTRGWDQKYWRYIDEGSNTMALTKRLT